MTGIELITKERQRQTEQEGWTPAHDDQHVNGELIAAAICYAHNAGEFKFVSPGAWPWAEEFWKPTGDNPIRDLVKAAALLAAEIDRLQRAE